MKYISSLLMLGLALSGNAQKDSTHKYTMPMLTRSIGASFQKFDGLNSRVAGLPQYTQLKDYSATLNLGWISQKKQLVTSGSLTLGSSMSGDREKKSSTVRYYGINADLGYDLIKKTSVSLYPFVGLGLQGYQAIFNKDNSGVNFDDVLGSSTTRNAISPVKFNNAFFVYRAGLGFSINSVKHPGCAIGLQAGYSGSFKSQTWKSNEDQILANAPTDKISQVFVGVSLISTPRFMNWK